MVERRRFLFLGAAASAIARGAGSSPEPAHGEDSPGKEKSKLHSNRNHPAQKPNGLQAHEGSTVYHRLGRRQQSIPGQLRGRQRSASF